MIFFLKKFIISLTMLSSISLFSLKRFVTSLIMLFSAFLFYSSIKQFIIIQSEKNLFNSFKKQKSIIFPLKIFLKFYLYGNSNDFK